MTQTLIFGIGIALLAAAVMLVLWLAEPVRSTRTYRSRRTGLLIEVRDPKGGAVSQVDAALALQDVLEGNCDESGRTHHALDVHVKL